MNTEERQRPETIDFLIYIKKRLDDLVIGETGKIDNRKGRETDPEQPDERGILNGTETITVKINGGARNSVKGGKERHKAFPNVWSPKDKQREIDMMSLIDQLFDEHGVEYILIYGSLLGCIRHGGQIPWDSDIDITVNRDHLDRLKKVLHVLEEEHDYRWLEEVTPGNGEYHKVFPTSGTKQRYYRWPFVDIFSYTTTDTEIDFHSNGPALAPLEPFAKESFFPLDRREFEGMMISVPAKPKVFLNQHYPRWDTTCVNFDRNDHSLTMGSMTVDELRPFHKFII